MAVRIDEGGQIIRTPNGTGTTRTPNRRINTGIASKIRIIFLIIFIIGVFIFCIRLFNIRDLLVSSTAEIKKTYENSSLVDEQTYQNNGFVFPKSDTELLNQKDIRNLSDNDLQNAINEIYARYGYIFRNDKVCEYYEQFSWYTGCIPADKFSADCFNQIERQNLNLLVNERKRRKAAK